VILIFTSKQETDFPGAHRDNMGKLEERLDGEGKRLFDEETHVRVLRILPNEEIEDNACKASMLQEYLSSVSAECVEPDHGAWVLIA
jgi:hypothetical protein